MKAMAAVMTSADRLCGKCEGEGQFTSERTSSGVDANGPWVVIEPTSDPCEECGGWGRVQSTDNEACDFLLDEFRTERAEARACGDSNFPTFREWKQNYFDPHAERKRAEWCKNDDV